MIRHELEAELEKIELMHTLFSGPTRLPAARRGPSSAEWWRRTTKKRPHAYEEQDSQTRCAILEDLTGR